MNWTSDSQIADVLRAWLKGELNENLTEETTDGLDKNK